MAYLRHYLNGQVVSIYEIKGSLVLGRHPECQIAIEDPTISSRHAEVQCGPGSADIADLGSTNGLRIGGQRVKSATLAPGDRFTLAAHEFEFLLAIPNDLDKTLKIKKSWIPGVYFTE